MHAPRRKKGDAQLIRRTLLFIALICLFAGGASAADGRGGATASPAGRFAFHNDPWISLHHFLYHAARAEAREMKLRGRVRLHDDDMALMTPELRAAMAPAIAAYAPYLEADLLFTPELRNISAELAAGGPDGVSDTTLREAIASFMPVYEKTFWPRHRQASETLIAGLSAQLEQYEAPMAARLAELLEGEWPVAPLRVYVAAYANWAGAYTAVKPNRIMLSADDALVAGAYGFEILFHEAAHTEPLGDMLFQAANDALAAAGVDDDRFWHYALFYAAGRAVADALGDPDYVPYASAAGLGANPGFKRCEDALTAAWDEADTLRERLASAARILAERDPQ